MFDLYPTTSESEMKSNFVVTYGKEVPLGYPGAGFVFILMYVHDIHQHVVLNAAMNQILYIRTI